MGYAGTPTNCDACHLTDFNSTTDPNHTSAGFSTDCATCHNESAWQPSSFHNSTGFPLTGSHTNVACLQCHSQRLRGHTDELRCVPPHGLQQHDRSEPRDGGLPDGLRAVPR